MQSTWDYLVQKWLEFLGTRQPPDIIQFTEREIRTPESYFNISYLTRAKFLNLNPNLYAVTIAPGGGMQVLKNGYNFPLKPGRYVIYYIDNRVRTMIIPEVSGVTADGANISLTLIITYRVEDPTELFKIENPVESVFLSVQSDLREYIKTRRYKEIFGNSDDQVIDNSQVARHIKQQYYSRHLTSKAFTLIDVIIKDREGDSSITEKRKSYEAQLIESESKIKIYDLNQKLAAQDAEMKKLQHKYASELEQEKAQANLQVQKMRSEQDMELQRLRNELQQSQDAWEQQQKRWLRSMDAIESALKSPYLREMEGVIGAIVAELRGLAGGGGSNSPLPEIENNSPRNKKDNLDTLTDKLFSLLDRRKNNG